MADLGGSASGDLGVQIRIYENRGHKRRLQTKTEMTSQEMRLHTQVCSWHCDVQTTECAAVLNEVDLYRVLKATRMAASERTLTSA